MKTIKPEVINHNNQGLIPKKTVKQMFGIKHPNTFIKDYKLLELNHTHFTWREIKLLYALRLFLERGKSGVFGRKLYLQLLQEHTIASALLSMNDWGRQKVLPNNLYLILIEGFLLSIVKADFNLMA